jgi:hypothetical protein
MPASLRHLAEINAFADVDPIEWQREVRQDLLFPGKEL